MPTGAILSRPNSSEYQPIGLRNSTDEENGDALQIPPQRRKAKFLRYFLAFCIAAISGVALLSIASRSISLQETEATARKEHHHHHHDEAHENHTKHPSCDCGSSTSEARAMGCKYDTLAACWLPDACRDDELSREFDAAAPNGTWTYFADQGATRTLTIQELSDLPDGNNCFWVPQRWHLLHCTFYWKKLYRKRWTGVTMEKHYDGLGHINHCEMLLLKSGNLDEIITEAAVGLSGDRLNLGPSGGCLPDQKKAHPKEHS
jgi:hypothetical protein